MTDDLRQRIADAIYGTYGQFNHHRTYAIADTVIGIAQPELERLRAALNEVLSALSGTGHTPPTTDPPRAACAPSSSPPGAEPPTTTTRAAWRRAADNDFTRRLDAVIDVEAGLREVLDRGKGQ